MFLCFFLFVWRCYVQSTKHDGLKYTYKFGGSLFYDHGPWTTDHGPWSVNRVRIRVRIRARVRVSVRVRVSHGLGPIPWPMVHKSVVLVRGPWSVNSETPRLYSGMESVYINQQICEVSRIRRETHAFEVYLMLLCLRLKSHAFARTAVIFFQYSFCDFSLLM